MKKKETTGKAKTGTETVKTAGKAKTGTETAITAGKAMTETSKVKTSAKADRKPARKKAAPVPEQLQAEAVVDGVHGYGRDEDYVMPTDPAVLNKLEWFRDQKIGLFMHWGLYSQMGMVESWGLSDSDKEWSYGHWDWDDPKECQRQYRKLNRSFNPIRLQPEKWALDAKKCGFRYVILTTKHHDGFCLWNTNQTNYKVTDPSCPFSEHKYADIIKHVFNACRKEGLGIVAYFSKADWNTPHYWAPDRNIGGETSRHANYDPKAEPDRWQKFVDFTQAQMMELVTGYGPLDVMWLDAGWVCPQAGEDIRLGEVVEKARKHTPGMLFADRTVCGPFENILTPEHAVPEKPMTSPWESCLVLDDNGWGHSFDHKYKTARQITHTFIDIVAKGGNLALGVGPQPDGRLAPEAIRILSQMGAWLEANGDAIYGTRISAPYKIGDWHFTCKGETRYAILTHQEGDVADGELMLPLAAGVKPFKTVTRVSDGASVPFRKSKAGYVLNVPVETGLTGTPFASAFRLA